MEIFQILPRPYKNIFEGQNGDKLLKETCRTELAHSTEDYIMDYISQVEDIHYWHHQILNIITAKEKPRGVHNM